MDTERLLTGQNVSPLRVEVLHRRSWSLLRLRHRPLFIYFLVFCCMFYGVFVFFPFRLSKGGLHPSHRYRNGHGLADGGGGGGARQARCDRRDWREHTHDLLVDNEGCVIPALDPFSDDVIQYVSDYPAITCASPPPLVRSNDTALFVDASLASAYNATNVSCCYTAMWRTPGPDWEADPGSKGPLFDSTRHGNDIRFAKECTPFDAAAVVPHEFVRVTCNDQDGTQVYKDFHAFVPEKRPRGHPGAVSPREFVGEDALNVLIVGIDSLSRLNLIRKMKLTLDLVESDLCGIGMLGYNKVEDNTFPNLVPLLSGMNIPELRNACWPAESAHFDACPWVWKDFNHQGYVNMFAEDTAWMGLFHYLKYGFVNQPTDYDPRPLMYLGEKELGRGGGFNAKYCIGQRHQIEVLFDYGRKFVDAMTAQGRKFFGLLWGTSLSHDYVNQPDEADAMYESFLRDLINSGVLNKTALIFMSDHGLRFGPILSTQQGQLENLTPAMYFILPDWVRAKYPTAVQNLEWNRRSLVTVFDLHRTLHDFMDLSALEEKRITAATSRVRDAFSGGVPPRGVSLFLPIPSSRTCEHAGIPSNYCACQHLTVVDVKDPEVRVTADFVVQQVNAMLESSTASAGCSRLALDEVLYARANAHDHEYHIDLRTSPGAAHFSVTVRKDPKSSTMKLSGSVSRLNAYGTDSWCTSIAAHRPLCFCREPPPPSASSPQPTTS